MLTLDSEWRRQWTWNDFNVWVGSHVRNTGDDDDDDD